MHHSELAKETPAMARFNHDSEAQRALAHTGRLRDIKPEDFDYYFLRGWARPHAGPDRQSRFNRADPILLRRPLPGSPGVMPRRRKTTKSRAVPNLSFPGPAPACYLQVMVKDSTKYAATGGWGTVNLMWMGYGQFDKDGNLPMRYRSKPASLATRKSKLATSSSYTSVNCH